MMRHLLAVSVAAGLSACATPANRITTALTDYGVPEARAACVGDRLGRELSLAQLRELSGLVRAYRENDPDPEQLNRQDLIRVASQVRDPLVPIRVARAAAGCGLVP